MLKLIVTVQVILSMDHLQVAKTFSPVCHLVLRDGEDANTVTISLINKYVSVVFGKLW